MPYRRERRHSHRDDRVQTYNMNFVELPIIDKLVTEITLQNSVLTALPF